jgi:hypothetical protein
MDSFYIISDFKKRNLDILNEKFKVYTDEETKLAGTCDFFMLLRDMFADEDIRFLLDKKD